MEYIYEYINRFYDWNNNDIIIKKIEGLTNNNYFIKNKRYNIKIILKLFKYQSEIDYKLYEKLYNHNIIGKIYHKFKEGYIQEWIEGRELNHEDLNCKYLKKIAKTLKKFHNITNLNHNDLNFKNILIDNNDNIKFIDFEYCNKLDVEYDICNFFCEWMYQYNSEMWYKPNYNLFPSKTQIIYFCKEYYDNLDDNILDMEEKILNILKKTKSVNEYWIEWSKKILDEEYFLFRYYKKKLLNYDYNLFLKNKIIYCDGTFDILHKGHLSFFKKVRNLGCKKLIIGVISDSNVKSYKRQPILSLDFRVEMLKGIGIVDTVISNCPFRNISSNFLDDYGIDLVVYGGDPNVKNPLSIWKEHYEKPIERNAFKILDYTHGISTTEIIQKCKNY